MNRVSDYAGFAVWLLGLGYIMLWPLTALPDGGEPLAAALICALKPLRFLCGLPHPLILPVGLQFIGCLSAGWVALRLALRLAMRGGARLRRARTSRAGAAQALSARIPAMALRQPRRRPMLPLRSVKPRRQFGLRGTPH